MAFGLAGDSGSFQANMAMVGGIVTGSSGEFLALPVSGTVLGGLSNLTTNEWSRFYLSDSFGNASGSIIQALNYLSGALKDTNGDVTGPSSATDNAVVRFDGTTGKLIQSNTLVSFTDAGEFTGGEGESYTFSANGQISGTNKVIAGTDVSGAGNVAGASLTSEEATISVAGVISGAGAVQGQKLTIANSDVVTTAGAVAAVTTVSGASSLAGAKLTINGTDVVTQAGALVAPTTVSGAGAVSGQNLVTEEATITAAGVISGAGAVSGQALTVANLFKVQSDGDVSGSGAAHFVKAVTGLSFAASSSLVAKTTVSGAGNVAGASLTTEEATISVAGVVSGAGAVQGASLTTEEATISVAGVMSGAGAVQGQSLKVANIFNVNKNGVVSSSGGGTFLGDLFANDMNVSGTLTAETFQPTALSGNIKINLFTSKILSNNAIETSASLLAKTTVSGAGNVAGASLTTEEATISVAGAISGAGIISGMALELGNSIIVTDEKAITNVTSISGASSLAGAKLTINGADIISQAGAVSAVTTVSGAGPGAFGALTTEEATISLAGVVSGAGALQGQSLSVAGGQGSISSAGALVAAGGAQVGSLESQGAVKVYGEGSLSGGVGAGVHCSNTGSANGSNHKAALYISSSDISTAANAALIPRMVLQGTNDAGALKDFMISVSGGMLQVVELTHGTALPV